MWIQRRLQTDLVPPARNLWADYRLQQRKARSIAQVVGSLEPVFQLSGFDAGRKAVLNSNLSDYRVIHFASHGQIDTEHPERSSIALSAFGETGERLPNSSLSLSDIFELRLYSDLVVLSACDTGLGQSIRGEGVLGLTNAFMSAGTKGVLSTFWAVQDKATAQLVRHFYTYYFEESLSPAAALRKAQLSIMSDPRWNDPYFWASFVYQGNW